MFELKRFVMDINQPVSFTDKAQKELKKLAQKGLPEGYGLRIMVMGGGCGGAVQYRLGFDKQQEDDERYTYQDYDLFIAKKHLMHLFGLEIDFEERQEEQGFVFHVAES